MGIDEIGEGANWPLAVDGRWPDEWASCRYYSNMQCMCGKLFKYFKHATFTWCGSGSNMYKATQACTGPKNTRLINSCCVSCCPVYCSTHQNFVGWGWPLQIGGHFHPPHSKGKPSQTSIVWRYFMLGFAWTDICIKYWKAFLRSVFWQSRLFFSIASLAELISFAL